MNARSEGVYGFFEFSLTFLEFFLRKCFNVRNRTQFKEPGNQRHGNQKKKAGNETNLPRRRGEGVKRFKERIYERQRGKESKKRVDSGERS